MTRGLAATPYFGSIVRPLRVTCCEEQFAAVSAIAVTAATLAAARGSKRFDALTGAKTVCAWRASGRPELMSVAPSRCCRQPRAAFRRREFLRSLPLNQHRT
jgi:hypothetical protein